ncbi:MAG: ribose-5-phosphate isomerase [Mycobacteriales bacterium]
MSTRRIYLGSDHAGFELKTELVRHLTRQGHQVNDCGPLGLDPEDDYPPYCLAAATKVAADPSGLGIVLGGSGNGEQIAANKVEGVRAVLAWSVEIAQLAREHNNANVLALGARNHTLTQAMGMVDAFIDTEFSGSARHVRRLRQIADYERTGELPGSSTGKLSEEEVSWAPPELGAGVHS